MHIYHDAEKTAELYDIGARSHPWSTSESDPSQRYVDFKAHAELIEESLEDFSALRGVPAVQSFYELVRYINRPHGLLETNDCGTRPVYPSQGQAFGAYARFEASGRLMLLFRNWWANASQDYTKAMHNCIFDSVAGYETAAKAVVGLVYAPVTFPSLKPQPWGRQVAIYWWTWGDTPEDTWSILSDVCAAITGAVDHVEAEMRRQHSANRAPDSPVASFSQPPGEETGTGGREH